MKHELKLDIKYFEQVKNGKMNFVIVSKKCTKCNGSGFSKNQDGQQDICWHCGKSGKEEYEFGDTLELKAHDKELGYVWYEDDYFMDKDGKHEIGWCMCSPTTKDEPDTIIVKVIEIISAEDFNDGIATVGGMGARSQTGVNLDRVEEVLKDCFGINYLPNDYVGGTKMKEQKFDLNQIVFETEKYYIYGNEKCFEIYAKGVTCAARKGLVTLPLEIAIDIAERITK